MGDAPTAQMIMRACLAMLDRLDAVVADLSPFRGPHVDDGTAFELGYAAACGFPIFGYSTDLRTLAERIAPAIAGSTVDTDGLGIEDFGEPFTAMIAGALTAPAFATPGQAIAAAAAHLRVPR